MNRLLSVLVISFLYFNSHSQISFEKGHFIDSTNQRVNCLIKNLDWKNNPTEFEYKLTKNSNPQIATIETVKEFGIDNISKYIRNTTKIDYSSRNLQHLSVERNPEYKELQVFLKCLIQGKANLYSFVEGDLRQYFYNSGDMTIVPLIFKRYMSTKKAKYSETTETNVAINDGYKQQLWNNLKCSSISLNKIKALEYKKNDLVKLFVKYNECDGQVANNFDEKQKRDIFNLSIRPGINYSVLDIKNSSSESRSVKFDGKINFRLGLEAEFIMPFNKNKWGIFLEPTYQKYSATKFYGVDDIANGNLTAKVEYSSIELPVGVRHYFFLNDTSKLFVNVAFVFNHDFDSTIDFVRDNGNIFRSFQVATGSYFSFGAGYKLNNKYSIELRYQNEDLTRVQKLLNSDYTKLSFILGYTLF